MMINKDELLLCIKKLEDSVKPTDKGTDSEAKIIKSAAIMVISYVVGIVAMLIAHFTGYDNLINPIIAVVFIIITMASVGLNKK